MPLSDNGTLRNFLLRLYPGLVIDDVPAPSGQRVVYFCHFEPDKTTDKDWSSWGDVVLKVSEGNSAQAIAYIQREIDILSKLDSPGYPRLLFDEVVREDPDTEDRLEYMRFITIEERIASHPLNEVLQLFNTEEKIIELLHNLLLVLRPLWEWSPPLVHRDLKPQNILITPDKNVVVIDLGIVRVEGSDGVTLSAFNIGPCTPRYASPEQATNDKRNISFKSDMFTLGVLCYELLSGSNPFDSGDDLLDEIAVKVVGEIPPALSTISDCSDKFSDIIEKMMEKKPYKRYRKIVSANKSTY